MAVYREQATEPDYGRRPLDLTSVESTKRSLQQYVGLELGLSTISVNDDLFASGFDFLQTMVLARKINADGGTWGRKVESKQIYDNPTVKKLAGFMHTKQALRTEDDDLPTWTEMQQVFYELSHDSSTLGHQSKNCEQPSSQQPGTHQVNDVELKGYDAPSYQASADLAFIYSMIPPDGGRVAWLNVLASCLININTSGLVNSFGDYQGFYRSNYLRDYSDSAISCIGTVQAALLLIVGVCSGPLFDLGYFKPTYVFSSVGLVFSQMMLSIATEYYQIILTQGLLSGLCMGLLYIPSVALIPPYFRHRRGLALGLALSGAPVGGIIYPIVFRSLLTSVGFGWATRTIGFIGLGTLLAATLLAKPMAHVRRPARNFLDLQALKEIPFIMFLATAFFIYNAWLIPYFLTPAFSESVGANPDTAFYLLAVLNAAQLFGRIIPGYFSDFIGGEFLLLLASTLAGILGLSWIAIQTIGGWVEFQIFYGFVSGMIATLPAVVVPYLCPSLAVLGTRMGMVYGAAGLGVLIGNPVALAVSKPEHGDFLGARLWMGLMALAGAACFGVTAVSAYRVRSNSQKANDNKPTLKKDFARITKVLG